MGMSDCPWSAWKLDFNATLVAGLHPGTKADARVPICDETAAAFCLALEAAGGNGNISDTKISLLLSYWKPQRGLLRPGLFGPYG
jgi:hypothetical protein